MKVVIRSIYLGTVLLLSAALAAVGCNQKSNDSATAQVNGKTDAASKSKEEADDHGWWCTEHGIPEEICGLCNKTYRDKQKAEGDWCETHRRLKSQCFKCNPTLYEKDFEPLYVAKYGKKPERPPETEFVKQLGSYGLQEGRAILN